MDHWSSSAHQPSARSQGAIPDLILEADEVVRLRAESELVLSRHTGQPVEALRADTDRDRIFTPEAAVAYGLVDQLVAYRKRVAAGGEPVCRVAGSGGELDLAGRRGRQ